MAPTTPAAKQKEAVHKTAKEAAKRKEIKQWKIANKNAKAHSTSPGVTPIAPRPLSKGAATFMARRVRAAKNGKTVGAKAYQVTYQEEY